MENLQININHVWVMVAACMVFFMQLGFTSYEAGFSQSKNAISISIRNLVEFLVSSLAFYVVGFGLMFGASHMGWLGRLGFIDFAGSTVVHSIGGWFALAGALVLGPRIGKYNPDGSSNPMGLHNVPLATLGTFFLWFGWVC